MVEVTPSLLLLGFREDGRRLAHSGEKIVDFILYIQDGVIQHIEGIPDDITIRVYDDEEYCLPENRSKEDYAISVSWKVSDVKGKAEEKGMKTHRHI